MSTSNQLEIIQLKRIRIIKYHLSEHKTVVVTIRNGKATVTVKRYGTIHLHCYEGGSS